MARRAVPSFEFQDFGISGIARYGAVSRVYEEFLRELQGPQGMKNFREFMDNDPIAGAILFGCYNLARSVTFRFDPVDSSRDASAVADFVSGAIIDDMGVTWPDLLTEILSMCAFGWSLFEWRFKRRLGPTPPQGSTGNEAQQTAAIAGSPNLPSSGLGVIGPTGQGSPSPDFAPSKFNDGRIGFRDWSLRSQETLFMWEFDELSNAKVMQQMAPPDYRLRRIPLTKSLLFRTRLNKNNPEGYSILRNAWTSYYFKKRIQVFEAIGVERDLAGYPVIEIQANTAENRAPDIFNPNDPKMVSLLAKMSTMVTRIRRDEQEGAVMPSWAKLVLTSAQGRRQFDTNQIVTRYDQRIGMSVLADFIMLGHDAVGSKGLASTKASLFAQALTGFLDNVCAVINRHAVPLLLAVNGIPLNLAPTMAHGDVETIDLADLGTYIKNLSGSGMALFPNADLEEALLEAAKLPATGVVDADQAGYDPDDPLAAPQGDESGDAPNPATTPTQVARPTPQPAAGGFGGSKAISSMEKRRRAFRQALRLRGAA